LEIGSVDGFQGREKEAIVISLVRSNPQRTVGFLAEDRRINVALTRARRHLCVVGDSDTISSHPFLARLLAYAQETSDYRSGQEYQSLELPEQDDKIIVDECDPEDWSAEPGAVCESEPAAAVAKTSKARISKAAQKKQQSKSVPTPAIVSQPRSSSSSATASKGKSKVEIADQDEEERVQFAMQVDDLVAHLVKRCNIARRISEGSKEIASQALDKAAAKIPLGNPLLCNVTATSADFVPSLNSFQRLIVHEVAGIVRFCVCLI
jgi:ATP-dependent exoDNAse (exonuclease V) beta subunit